MGRTKSISAGFGCCLRGGEGEFVETPGLGIPNRADGGHTEDAPRGSCDAFVGRRRALVERQSGLGRHIPDRRAPWLQRPSDSWSPLKRDAPDTARASSSGAKPNGQPGIGGFDGEDSQPLQRT